VVLAAMVVMPETSEPSVIDQGSKGVQGHLNSIW
jgi:hypothetical protein